MVAAKVIVWLARKPVPDPTTLVVGNVLSMGEISPARDHMGVAVNVEVVVTPATVNDSAVFGAASTTRVQVSVP